MKTSLAGALTNLFFTAALGGISAVMLTSSAPLLPVIGALGMAAAIVQGAITLGSFIGSPQEFAQARAAAKAAPAKP